MSQKTRKKSKKNKPSDQGQKSITVSKSPQKLQVISAVLIPQEKEENKTAKDNGKCCSLCNQEFTTSIEHPLSLKSKSKFADGSSICVGCRNLFSDQINDKKVIDAIKIKLLHSYNSNGLKEKQLEESANIISDDKLFSHYLKSIRRNMKSRCIRYSNTWAKTKDEAASYCRKVVPSCEELKAIALKSKGICSVSGVLGTWNYSKNNSDWNRLNWDHVVPISRGGSFEGNNLQLVLRCINQVKGNNSMTELRRYLSQIK
ncbi:hypothetical protein BD770DRAFT_407658 [Pilaira anomala]|nr:hypothetical protein BD770DRAFT_407658 [Pilaira anomala]